MRRTNWRLTWLQKQAFSKHYQQLLIRIFKKDIVSLGFVKDVAIDGSSVGFTIELTTPACPVKEEFRRQAETAVMALDGGKQC